jgi:hypothetical protein
VPLHAPYNDSVIRRIIWTFPAIPVSTRCSQHQPQHLLCAWARVDSHQISRLFDITTGRPSYAFAQHRNPLEQHNSPTRPNLPILSSPSETKVTSFQSNLLLFGCLQFVPVYKALPLFLYTEVDKLNRTMLPTPSPFHGSLEPCCLASNYCALRRHIHSHPSQVYSNLDLMILSRKLFSFYLSLF